MQWNSSSTVLWNRSTMPLTRYEISGALSSGCSRKGASDMVSTPFEDDQGSHQGDQEPSRPKPPGDFQRPRDSVAVGRAGLLQRLIGNNPIVQRQQQQQREQDEEDHPCNSAPDGLLLEQRSTYECAERDKGRAADERIVRDHCDGRDQVRCHCGFHPRRRVDASNFRGAARSSVNRRVKIRTLPF
jgi:hypothetical protein